MASGIMHYMDESDIGSGEKNAGQIEIEQEVGSLRVPEECGGARDGRHMQDVVEEQEYADQSGRLNGGNLASAQREQQNFGGHPASAPGDLQTAGSRMLRLGARLARITVVALPDHTYEAQVYVRLAREPEIAETFIPAGNFITEQNAWAAAEERARRALSDDEF